MRVAFAAVVVTLLLAPCALAQPPAAPGTIALVMAPGAGVLISWSPVTAAEYYVVYRGPNEWELEPIATTSGTFYVAGDDFPDYVWGVASVANGASSNVHQAGGPRSDCAAVGTNAHIAIKLDSCRPA